MRVGRCGSGGRGSGDHVARRRGEIGGVEPELGAEDGVGVGAEHGGGPQGDVGVLEAERLVEQQDLAVDGCSTCWTNPRAVRCGSFSTSVVSITADAAMPASARIVIASIFVRAAHQSAMMPCSSAACSWRPFGVQEALVGQQVRAVDDLAERLPHLGVPTMMKT